MSTESPSQTQSSPPESTPLASQEMLLDLNFVPTWAKGSAGRNPYEDAEMAPERRDRRGGGGGRRDDRRPPRGGGRGPQNRAAGGDRRGEPRRDDRGRGGPRSGPGSQRRDDRRGDDRRHEGRRQDDRPRGAPPLQVDIRFLPDRDMLGAAVREMHSSLKAYPIMDLASLFIQKPDHYQIKLQAPKPKPGQPPVMLYQCRRCRAVFTDAAACEQHAIARHLGEFFEVEMVEGEAPRGNFLVVGRCRRTGTLLGPPNHHAFTRKLLEMVSTRFPGMSLDDYRSQIEMVRDPEVIEQWKNESRVQKRYRLKTKTEAAPEPSPEPEAPVDDAPAPPEAEGPIDDAPAPPEAESAEESDAADESDLSDPSDPSDPSAASAASGGTEEAVDEEEARRRFRERHLSRMVHQTNRAVVPATVAQSMEDGPVKRAIREAWLRESRFPLTMSLAMRPAFRHMRLHTFKTNRKNVFVTAVKPKPLDPGVAIDSIRDELNYMHDHPGCTRQELVEALRPATALDSPEVAEVVNNLRWLIEKGHVIEFYDGRLSVPAERAGPVQSAPADDPPATA